MCTEIVPYHYWCETVQNCLHLPTHIINNTEMFIFSLLRLQIPTLTILLMVILKSGNRRERGGGAVVRGGKVQAEKRKKKTRKEAGAGKHVKKGRDEKERELI